MHHSLVSFVALTTVAALALGGAACVANPTGPSDPGATGTLTNSLNPSTPADWVGSTWTLVSIQAAGQALQPAPTGVAYEVTLGENRISTKVDCNTCGGSLSIDGNTVTIGPVLACTRAACSTMAFADAYLALLTGQSNALLDGNSLTLTSPRGMLRFRR